MSNLWANFEDQAKKYSIHTQISTFNYSINISLQHNYLYTETPKGACSTIKTTLQKMELNDPTLYRDEFEDIHDRNFSPLLAPSQIGNLEPFFEGSRLFKFCFSRNPFTRLLSAYMDKIVTNKPEKKPILQALGKDVSNLDQDVSFEEFVNIVCNQDIINMNPHWRTQYYQTFQENIDYDFVGKVENLDNDLSTVLSIITPHYQPFLSNERRHATGSKDLLNNYYTPQLIKQVQEKFEKDFDYFDYNYELG